jgi:glutathione S-transferase
MARIRSIFPGLFTDEAFVSLSMAARVLLLGIWTDSDDQGVFEWKPVSLKMRIFSADNIDVVPLLAELVRADVIRQFSFEGKSHGAVRNFCKYQKPKSPKFRDLRDEEIRKYVASKYPKEEVAPSQPQQFPQKVEMARLREEGGDSLIPGVGLGGGEKPPRAKPSRLDSKEKLTLEFAPSDATREAIRMMGFGDQQFNKEFSRFHPYHMGRGTVADDWNAMLVSWFQRATPEPSPAPTAGLTMLNKTFVILDTLGWKSWVAHIKETRGITWSRTIEKRDDAGRVQLGWWWPSEYAPGYDEATGERVAPSAEENAA